MLLLFIKQFLLGFKQGYCFPGKIPMNERSSADITGFSFFPWPLKTDIIL
jgi:hypothetical protein